MSKLHKNIRTEARVAGQDFPKDQPDLSDLIKYLYKAAGQSIENTFGPGSNLAYIQDRWSRGYFGERGVYEYALDHYGASDGKWVCEYLGEDPFGRGAIKGDCKNTDEFTAEERIFLKLSAPRSFSANQIAGIDPKKQKMFNVEMAARWQIFKELEDGINTIQVRLQKSILKNLADFLKPAIESEQSRYRRIKFADTYMAGREKQQEFEKNFPRPPGHIGPWPPLAQSPKNRDPRVHSSPNRVELPEVEPWPILENIPESLVLMAGADRNYLNSFLTPHLEVIKAEIYYLLGSRLSAMDVLTDDEVIENIPGTNLGFRNNSWNTVNRFVGKIELTEKDKNLIKWDSKLVRSLRVFVNKVSRGILSALELASPQEMRMGPDDITYSERERLLRKIVEELSVGALPGDIQFPRENLIIEKKLLDARNLWFMLKTKTVPSLENFKPTSDRLKKVARGQIRVIQGQQQTAGALDDMVGWLGTCYFIAFLFTGSAIWGTAARGANVSRGTVLVTPPTRWSAQSSFAAMIFGTRANLIMLNSSWQAILLAELLILPGAITYAFWDSFDQLIPDFFQEKERFKSLVLEYSESCKGGRKACNDELIPELEKSQKRILTLQIRLMNLIIGGDIGEANFEEPSNELGGLGGTLKIDEAIRIHGHEAIIGHVDMLYEVWKELRSKQAGREKLKMSKSDWSGKMHDRDKFGPFSKTSKSLEDRIKKDKEEDEKKKAAAEEEPFLNVEPDEKSLNETTRTIIPKDKFDQVLGKLKKSYSEREIKNNPTLFLHYFLKSAFNIPKIKVQEFYETMNLLESAPNAGSWKSKSYEEDGTYSIALKLDNIARLANQNQSIDPQFATDRLIFAVGKYGNRTASLVYSEAAAAAIYDTLKKGGGDANVDSKLAGFENKPSSWIKLKTVNPSLFNTKLANIGGKGAINAEGILYRAAGGWEHFEKGLREVIRYANKDSNNYYLIKKMYDIAKREKERLNLVAKNWSKFKKGKNLNNFGILEDINFANFHYDDMARSTGYKRPGPPGSVGGGPAGTVTGIAGGGTTQPVVPNAPDPETPIDTDPDATDTGNTTGQGGQPSTEPTSTNTPSTNTPPSDAAAPAPGEEDAAAASAEKPKKDSEESDEDGKGKKSSDKEERNKDRQPDPNAPINIE